MVFDFTHQLTAPNRRTPVDNEERCDRCGGSGIFFVRNVNGVDIPAKPDDGICYRCHGTGIDPYYHKEDEFMFTATMIEEAKKLGFDLTNVKAEVLIQLKVVLAEMIAKENGMYDHYIEYIDNGRQYRAAEESNRRITKRVAELEEMVKAIESYENTHKEDETIMTAAKMMQELNDHGYTFSRPLSDEEIRTEYAEMLSDLALEKDIANGMNPVDALKKSLNNDNNKEDAAMNATIAKEANYFTKGEIDLNKFTKDSLRHLLLQDFGVEYSNTLFKKTKKEDLIVRYEGLVEAAKNHSAEEKPVVPFIMQGSPEDPKFVGKVCCGTGRRPKDLFGYEKANYMVMIEKMKNGVKWFYDTKQVRYFITGGAQGWDQLLFWAVNAVKREDKYADIKNIVYLPMKGQELKWAADGLFGKKEYCLMLKLADAVNYITDIDNTASYKQVIDAMYARNHAMVCDSDYVFGCYCDDTWFKPDTKGGTAECLRYAYGKKVDTAIMYYNTMTTKMYEFSKIQ